MAWQGTERTAITEEEEAKALAQRIGQKMDGFALSQSQGDRQGS